ncbi:MFS transporter [Micromonospora purpureochromogenes]|uniref:Na+/melibiose symporter-like transporter n=1 Tax=Micromonospora purpureochromogenes TaxID=47872 RepID=A0ABX2RF49_9ACTN|nr:MFS transporter [Micromonospora purpureochromogenes]NYF54961.1 Na+/melibiose symporter-like transporter [Micromonospora purpureochromogenes]
MRRLWRILAGNGDLRLLLAANLISLTGDWILRTGLAYQIYVLTGSTLASAGSVLASLLPQIALGSIAGVYADRWDRRLTMVVTNLLMVVALLPLLSVQHAGQVWLVYLVIAVQSCLAPFFTSAEAALVPSLVADDHLVTVNSLNGQAREVARLVGAALGGAIAGMGGIALLSLVDMVTFALAAGLLWPIRTRRRPGSATRPHMLREWAEGMRIALSSRVLQVFLAFTVITGIGEAIMGTLMAPFVRDVLGGDARVFGVIMAAQAVGGIVGGLTATLIGHHFAPRAMFGWGTLVFGALDLVLFLYPLAAHALWPAPVLIALVGLPAAFLTAGGMTVFQNATADNHRGRVFGAMAAVNGAAMLLGTIGAGTLGERIGILPVLATQGAAYCLAGVVVLLALPIPPPVQRQQGEREVAVA